MTGLHTGKDAATLARACAVIAGGGRKPADPRANDWIEATMRRTELPSVVDLAKNRDIAQRLSRLLGI
ncbi:hypothetical protein [Albidovulum sp.]|uniref:hypothetical protein n=1 Tax=Albidovulum sp. TaxID=1872424 RepID=UPI0039B8B243